MNHQTIECDIKSNKEINHQNKTCALTCFVDFALLCNKLLIHLLIIQLEMLHREYTKPFISANERANVQQMQVE
jgi:hypothetical protein